MSTIVDRRTVLASAGALVGSGVVAGCLGADSTETDDEQCNVDPLPRECKEASIAEEFADVENFDGIVDRTGRETVTIDVGVKNGEAYVGFGPPVVRVTAGTNLVWRWTGEGGEHDVVATSDHDVDSDRTAREGYTYEYRYDGDMSRVDLSYHCTNHRSARMRGLVLDDSEPTM